MIYSKLISDMYDFEGISRLLNLNSKESVPLFEEDAGLLITSMSTARALPI